MVKLILQKYNWLAGFLNSDFTFKLFSSPYFSYRVIVLTGHMNNFRVWEIAINLMNFELVTCLSGYVPGPVLNMKKKKLDYQLS